MTTLGKFVVIEHPQALPGECYFCRSADRKLFIDTGQFEPGYGAIYICVDECLKEMAKIANFIHQTEIENLVVEKEFLQSKVEELIPKAELADRFTHEAGILVSSTVLSNPARVNNHDLVDVQASSVEQSELSRRENSLGTGEGEITESVNDEGMAKLHSDDKSDEFSLQFGH